MILVTGGCGFIGSNFVLDWLATEAEPLIVIDKLTYAGNLNNLVSAKSNPNYQFIHGDINNHALIQSLLNIHKPRALLNFAAESHVDRSILNPGDFIKTNINGTFNLLETSRQYWLKLDEKQQAAFRFLQISTDEVYGSLNDEDPPFTETTAYAPNNPYSASKASSDHLVNAYHHTYGLPTLITNCSNNYGPYQFPEKLIPLTILNALEGKPLCIYGDGLQRRDWLYVADHCEAIKTTLIRGTPGETYNIGGHNEKTNLELVQTICQVLDEIQPCSISYASLITHVKDRPGHDRRYAIDASKIARQLQWQPRETFQSGLNKTISWYLNAQTWINSIKNQTQYQSWIETHYKNKELT